MLNRRNTNRNAFFSWRPKFSADAPFRRINQTIPFRAWQCGGASNKWKVGHALFLSVSRKRFSFPRMRWTPGSPHMVGNFSRHQQSNGTSLQLPCGPGSHQQGKLSCGPSSGPCFLPLSFLVCPKPVSPRSSFACSSVRRLWLPLPLSSRTCRTVHRVREQAFWGVGGSRWSALSPGYAGRQAPECPRISL